MHKLAEHCKYGDVRAKLSGKLQFNPKLDLSIAIVQVRREKQQAVLQSADSSGQIDAVSHDYKHQEELFSTCKPLSASA